MKIRISIIALLFVLLAAFNSNTAQAQPGMRHTRHTTSVSVRTGSPRHYGRHRAYHRVEVRGPRYHRGYNRGYHRGYNRGYRHHGRRHGATVIVR